MTSKAVTIAPTHATPAEISKAERKLATATTVPEVVEVKAEFDAIEEFMHQAGKFPPETIRPVNEMRMRARWKLGQLLSKVARVKPRATTTGESPPQFKKYIQAIGLDSKAATALQRLGALPAVELAKVFAENKADGVLTTEAQLVIRARPYWLKASRKAKHQAIAAAAVERTGKTCELGPFPLIYADPPWTYETYSEKGKGNTPEKHYACLTDEEIAKFKVNGKPMREVAAKAAALFLWCTSSNMPRALAIMEAWGFQYSTSAVWVKDRGGQGLVFVNWHEVLLYGTRGGMPGPQYKPKSVFKFSRKEHSAKPPQIRKEIERMYPDFTDATTRLELFARGSIPGWSTYGLEAK